MPDRCQTSATQMSRIGVGNWMWRERMGGDFGLWGSVSRREHPCVQAEENRPWVPMEHHVGIACLCVFRECFCKLGRGGMAEFMPRDGGWRRPICLLGHFVEGTIAPYFSSFNVHPFLFIQRFATHMQLCYPVKSHSITSGMRGLTSRFLRLDS